MDMVKQDLKCPRCGKRLLRSYSFHIKSITCSCGCRMNLMHNVERAQPNKLIESTTTGTDK
jgi:hypothetical protein